MNVNLSWVLPTPTPRQKPIAGVKVEKRVAGAPGWTVLSVVPAATLTLVDQDVQPGDWEYRGTVVDNAGKESAPLVKAISVPFDNPSPLTSLTLVLA